MGTVVNLQDGGPFSPENRRSNQVYLIAKADELIRSIASNDEYSTEYVNDNHHMEQLVSKMRRTRLCQFVRKPIEVLHDVFGDISKITISELSVEFSKTQNMNRISYRGYNDRDVFVIREDGITGQLFARFLEPLTRIPKSLQPLIFVEPNKDLGALKKSLETCSDKIEFVDFCGEKASESFWPTAHCRSETDFLSLFSDQCFDTIARTPDAVIKKLFSRADSAQGIALELLHIRSLILSRERHHLSSHIEAKVRQIESNEEDLIGRHDYDHILFFRALMKLSLLFCTEDPNDTFDHALAVAAYLNNDLLSAYCLRYANFLNANGHFKAHCLQRAETVFQKHKLYDHFIYSRNNRILTTFRLDTGIEHSFKELLETIEEYEPDIYRKEDLIFNAGVEQLIEKSFDHAYEHFLEVSELGGRPLVEANARLCIMICRTLDHQKVSGDDVISLVSYIDSMVDPKNRYHITNLILNLMTVAKRNELSIPAEIWKPDRLAIGVATDVRDALRSNEFLASNLGLYNAATPKQIGRKGHFVSQTGFSPCYFFVWS